MDSLLFTLNAVLPIIICIVIGYVLKLLKLFPDNFWGMLNKLCFRLLLPVLLFKNIYDIADIRALGEYWQVILFCAIAIIAIFFIGLLIVIFFIKDDKQKGVVLQCVFRSNYAIIGIGLIQLLASNFSNSEYVTAVGIGAVISAISIPIFNILAIISLSIFVKEENGTKPSAKEIFIKICKNPLIIGVLSGIVVLCIRALIPYDVTHVVTTTLKNGVEVVEESDIRTYAFKISDNIPLLYTTIKWIAQTASPIALIALGGAFSFKAVSKLKYQIILGTSLRILVVPVLALLVAYFMGFRNIYFPALIALFGTPVAVSSAPMSYEMNNDGELAGQLVVWTSILSAFSLFLIIFTSSRLGIL